LDGNHIFMIKNWIIKTFFQSYQDAWQRQASMDAFKKAHEDIMETMADDLDKKAEELAVKKLNDLLSPVDLKSVVTLNKQIGAIFIGGERVEDSRLTNLKAEAKFITNSEIWHLLSETPKSLAERSMFVNGESLDDMKKGRSILYTLASQKNILDTFLSYKPKPLAQNKTSSV
jgi:hypothetical protein